VFGYRHGFHAGNFADVVKHTLLVLLIEALRRKESPFCILDTHAARGLYDLRGEQAQKRREYEAGIGRLWQRTDLPPPVATYLATIRALNEPHQLRWYPGSPRLARALLRPQDRLIAIERNPQEHQLLKQGFGRDRQVAIHCQDGYQGLKAFLPPKERRGLVLIDPPYELQDEYSQAVAGLLSGWQRWPSGLYALWYPILTEGLRARLFTQLRATALRRVLVVELILQPPSVRNRLNGSGMVLVNPPFGCEQQLAELLPWLQQALAPAGGHSHALQWLIP